MSHADITRMQVCAPGLPVTAELLRQPACGCSRAKSQMHCLGVCPVTIKGRCSLRPAAVPDYPLGGTDGINQHRQGAYRYGMPWVCTAGLDIKGRW